MNNRNVDALVNKLNVHLQKGKVRVHPNCKNVRFQLATGLWNANRTDFMRTADGGHWDAGMALA